MTNKQIVLKKYPLAKIERNKTYRFVKSGNSTIGIGTTETLAWRDARQNVELILSTALTTPKSTKN